MKKKRIRIVQFLLLIICLISAGILFYDMVILPKENHELIQQLKEDFPEIQSPGKEPAGEESPVSGVDLFALQSLYPDVQGWITIPGTNIDYPVLQGSEAEPEYYLRRNYQKKWDINGSIFLQWNCDVLESQNLVIYGHNMNSGAMFGNLPRFAAKDYWQENRSVLFQTVKGVSEYEIVAVLKVDISMFPFQQVEFAKLEGLKSYLEQAKSMMLFETGVAGAKEKQVLTLVTCSYEWQEARNIVIAVKK